ncbi:hypothetical protein [endosymbiont 'TC1' of Trimyema compressum]|uniref:hypothetical protein n=1 Tax=endosymbiont 'TC1' of Trimyema compressum TaxID=243899 RepID=UPI000AA881BD|nr:hypothetical protein [endosymbiont 'TC1' of Trimyema compressum]
MQNAQYAAKKINDIRGVQLKFETPFFKEFVVDFKDSKMTVKAINKKLLDKGIFEGSDLEKEGLPDCDLYCVTEIHTKDKIDELVDALKAIVD